MQKYDISKEYGIYAKFIPPYNKAIFPLAALLLNIAPKALRSNKDIKISKIPIKVATTKNINLYIFEPLRSHTEKALLFIHGGGFTYKGYNSHFQLCQKFAVQGNSKVVYVDYRLAPKYKYPVPINDCFAAYNWLLKNADFLKIATNKIIISGDSAGGCLAVDVTLKAIEEKLPKPCYQLLIYPALDKRMGTKSMKEYTNTPMWNTKLNRKMWKYYLGENNYISPNEREVLNNMPPTYIETAQYDCLHDEGIEFAKKLKASEVPVTVYETKHTMHGYDIKNCTITETAIQKRIEILNKIT